MGFFVLRATRSEGKTSILSLIGLLNHVNQGEELPLVGDMWIVACRKCTHTQEHPSFEEDISFAIVQSSQVYT